MKPARSGLRLWMPLTPPAPVGIIDNMKANLILRHKDISPEGHILELVIWRVPSPAPPCSHPLYRLAYMVNDERVIGFDNERGKGDHCHVAGAERPYVFRGLHALVEDFIAEVEQWKSAH